MALHGEKQLEMVLQPGSGRVLGSSLFSSMSFIAEEGGGELAFLVVFGGIFLERVDDLNDSFSFFARYEYILSLILDRTMARLWVNGRFVL